MTKLDDQASVNLFLILFIATLVLFIGTSAFAVWAFSSRQKYKNQTDQIVSSAVNSAKQQQFSTDQNTFNQAAKLPLDTYTGPSAYGTIKIEYPKTWSAYVAVSADNGSPLDGYFQPQVVPDVSNATNNFALRVEVVNEQYAQVVSQYTQLVQQGGVAVTPYDPPKVPSTVPSVRIDGQIAQDKQGSMIIMQLRSQTLELWTESTQYESDFNNYILPNFTFSP